LFLESGYLVYNGIRVIRIRYRENADLCGFFILLMMLPAILSSWNEGSHKELYKVYNYKGNKLHPKQKKQKQLFKKVTSVKKNSSKSRLFSGQKIRFSL